MNLLDKPIRLVLLFCGQSCEHEVSVTSACSVAAAVDQHRYDVRYIGISKQGRWRLLSNPQPVFSRSEVLDDEGDAVWVDHNRGGFMTTTGSQGAVAADVVFPVLHGTRGEDGSVQGLLELAGLAYIGSGIGGSAVGMDKSLTKRVLQARAIPQLPYLVYSHRQWQTQMTWCLQQVNHNLQWPLFVKPCSQGSSIGVARVEEEETLCQAVTAASQYDQYVLIEQAATGCREIECAVLGNDAPRASIAGEIRPGQGFYDYRAKYQEESTELLVPAQLSAAQTARVQQLAVAVFQAVGAADLARVDFFVDTEDNRFYVNEINTLPGFTPISMYPRLWRETGVSYPELIDTLVALAIQRQQQQARLRQVL